MWRMIGSSRPGDVSRDEAVRLLTGRAVLTRAVCRELLEAGGEYAARRPGVALGLLLQWARQHRPAGPGATDPRASDDESAIRQALAAYGPAHPKAARAPTTVECWSGPGRS